MKIYAHVYRNYPKNVFMSRLSRLQGNTLKLVIKFYYAMYSKSSGE